MNEKEKTRNYIQSQHKVDMVNQVNIYMNTFNKVNTVKINIQHSQPQMQNHFGLFKSPLFLSMHSWTRETE